MAPNCSRSAASSDEARVLGKRYDLAQGFDLFVERRDLADIPVNTADAAQLALLAGDIFVLLFKGVIGFLRIVICAFHLLPLAGRDRVVAKRLVGSVEAVLRLVILPVRRPP